MRRMGLTGFWSISPAAANGVQYQRRRLPISVPGPTSIRALFCSELSIGPLLPEAEGPTAAGVGGRAVYGHVIHHFELQRLLLHRAADRNPVERLRRRRKQPGFRNVLERLRVLALERTEHGPILVFVHYEVAQAAGCDDGHPRRFVPGANRRADRLPELVRALRRRRVRRIARVLEHGQDRPRLVVEQSLDDERVAVWQALLVVLRLAHGVELAVRGGIAARHATTVGLLDVGDEGGVELVFRQVLDQEATEAAGDWHFHRQGSLGGK